MLREILEHWLTPCPRAWKRMGFLREQIAIDARYRRNRKVWDSHLRQCHERVITAAAQASGKERVVVLGGGLVYDIPVGWLCERFRDLVMIDVVHRPSHRRRMERLGVRCVSWDVSGVLERVWAESGRLGVEELGELVRGGPGDLEPVIGGRADLVISMNVASQLMLLPLEWLERQGGRRWSEDAGVRSVEVDANRAHLRWLEAQTGTKLLVTEVERLRVGTSGAILEREELEGLSRETEPVKTWSWDLAPIPEVSRRYHLRRRMAAWVWT